jgi:pyrimidine-nucleoside phosphorylase
MIPAKLIEKKRDGFELNSEEIEWFVRGTVENKIDDCQLSALLMSIYFNGMSDSETFSLVNSMVNSGKKLKFNNLGKYIADKHSTGGIGDKTSFVLAPILSTLDIIVPMIAGRGLAYTGGTIDKLESIPNFQTTMDIKRFENQIEKVGCGIISQSSEICPADKKIYSIRDLTGTIPSMPLICSSIMSKKIAEGLDGLIMDIKVGNGAFMKTITQARKLAYELQKIGNAFNIKTDITYSNMSQPLGRYAGLGCEIFESINCLRGNGPGDLIELSLDLGAKILLQNKKAKTESEAKNKMLRTIDDGSALKKFEEIIDAQGGDLEYFQSSYTNIKNELSVHADSEGYISSMDTEKIGWALVEMGCGRRRNRDVLDYSAGIKFNFKVGEKVKVKEQVYTLFGKDIKKLEIAKSMLHKTFKISSEKISKPKLILS